jgi:hypothetical protein
MSTPEKPIAESDGFHCSDLSTADGLADTTVGSVQVQGLWHMKRWLAEWKAADTIITQAKRIRVEL